MESPEVEVNDQTLGTQTIKAFTVSRVTGGWRCIELTIEVDVNDGIVAVTNVEATEPDLKALALEQFKIRAFKYWSNL